MTLAKTPGTLDLTVWGDIISAALAWAYDEIVAGLSARGYSQLIIPNWDRGAEYQRSLALYWSLTHRGAIGPDDAYSVTNVERFDLRDSLHGNAAKNVQAVFVTVGGNPMDPDTTYGQAVVGPMDPGIQARHFGEWLHAEGFRT